MLDRRQKPRLLFLLICQLWKLRAEEKKAQQQLKADNPCSHHYADCATSSPGADHQLRRQVWTRWPPEVPPPTSTTVWPQLGQQPPRSSCDKDGDHSSAAHTIYIGQTGSPCGRKVNLLHPLSLLPWSALLGNFRCWRGSLSFPLPPLLCKISSCSFSSWNDSPPSLMAYIHFLAGIYSICKK